MRAVGRDLRGHLADPLVLNADRTRLGEGQQPRLLVRKDLGRIVGKLELICLRPSDGPVVRERLSTTSIARTTKNDLCIRYVKITPAVLANSAEQARLQVALDGPQIHALSKVRQEWVVDVLSP